MVHVDTSVFTPSSWFPLMSPSSWFPLMPPSSWFLLMPPSFTPSSWFLLMPLSFTPSSWYSQMLPTFPPSSWFPLMPPSITSSSWFLLLPPSTLPLHDSLWHLCPSLLHGSLWCLHPSLLHGSLWCLCPSLLHGSLWCLCPSLLHGSLWFLRLHSLFMFPSGASIFTPSSWFHQIPLTHLFLLCTSDWTLMHWKLAVCTTVLVSYMVCPFHIDGQVLCIGVQFHTEMVSACLAVTCHLHFWYTDQGFYVSIFHTLYLCSVCIAF